MAYRGWAPLHSNSTNQPSAISGALVAAAVTGDRVLICAMQATGVNTLTIASSGPTAPTLQDGPRVVTSNISAYLWDVTLASGDVGATITITSTGAGYFIGAMLAFSGRSTAAPVLGAAPATSVTSLTSPAITTTVDLSDVGFFYIVRSALATSPTITPPAGSQTKAGESYTANTASPNFDVCAAYRTTPGAAGDYGGAAATSSQTATGAVLYTVGLAPASTTGQGFTVSKVNTGGTTTRLSVYVVNGDGTTTQIASSTD